MSLKTITALSVSAVVLFSTHASFAIAAEFKLNGSTTVVGNIIGPNKAAIEQETGLTLVVTPNGSGNGLKDLAAGRADAAMISAPLKSEADAINKASPGSLEASGFVENNIGAAVTKIIVNSANPVKSLSATQLQDIFSGKISSWKDVGGADQPILVVAEAPGAGSRAMVIAQILGGTEIAGSARAVTAVQQITQIVGQAPNAIGYGVASNGVAAIPNAEAKQPLIIITKGAASGDAKKLIDAAAKFGSK